MQQFQQLMRAALLAGVLSGGLLFIYQYVVMVPRIVAAEAFEKDEHREHSAWKPQDGWERHLFTAASTMLTGIGFASVLLAMASLTGLGIDARRGLLWGLAGFVCFAAAPALGLPPEPPGVPVADVRARQLWWAMTVGLTGLALWLVARGRWAGGLIAVLPHLIGAPQAAGPQTVPAGLVREFAIASLAGSAMFWLALGSIAGWLFPVRTSVTRTATPPPDSRSRPGRQE